MYRALAALEVAYVAHGLARLGNRDPVLWGTVIKAACSGLVQWGPREVAKLAWAAAKVASSASHPPSNQELSNLVWAAASLGFADRGWQLSRAVAGQLVRRSPRLKPQALANAAWACAKLGYTDSGFYKAMLLSAGQRPHELNTQELSNLVWALATCLHATGQLELDGPQVQALLALLQALPSLGAHELAVLVEGLSRCQLQGVDSRLFAALGHAAVPHVLAGAFSPGGLASLLAGFARARQRHAPLGNAAARVAALQAEAFTCPQLANLLWALSVMRVVDRQLVERVAELLLQGPLAGPGLGAGVEARQGVWSGPRPPPSTVPTPAATAPPGRAQPGSQGAAGHQPAWAAAGREAGQGGAGVGVSAAPGPGPSPISSLDSFDDLLPRSSAASLLQQLGWVEGDEEDEDGEWAEEERLPPCYSLLPLVEEGQGLDREEQLVWAEQQAQQLKCWTQRIQLHLVQGSPHSRGSSSKVGRATG
ncbi:monooxygenase, FAD-binding [Haematococcus lacustris]|uniref:Monooxygenase, FAD-binding n=1 Tax=Haematococcus lacustris TaxID=44745 RepID=A0A699YK89_HAELA|nr:monooxygenase, FAD-binding [Haematococcus lacustris]